MMIYSHFLNGIANILTIVIPMMGSIFIIVGSKPYHVQLPFPLPIRILLAVAWAGLTFWFCVKIIMPISNWLYLLIFRGTVVTFAEAVELSPLFQLNGMKWYPMREITKLPRNERVPYMRAALESLRAQGKIKRPKTS